ncbi:MAG: hypothetical protein L3J43_07830 [Sulfurovum sp.]|nr:hypothetical protein [Sulfurovum sp.]
MKSVKEMNVASENVFDMKSVTYWSKEEGMDKNFEIFRVRVENIIGVRMIIL